MKKHILLIDTLKGIFIGACMLVPGVSGGTTAIILDVYDKLIGAVSSFFKNPKKNFIILLTIGGGAILGIIIFSRLILFIVTKFEFISMYLFFGAILGSIPLIYRKSGVKKFSISLLIYPILGSGIAFATGLIPKGFFNLTNESSFKDYLYIIIAGIVLSIALVLPGISVSYMLLILGIYELTLLAIENFQILFLAMLILGTVIGIVLSTKILEIVMNNYPKYTYLTILGFVLISLREIIPGIPSGINIFWCLLTMFIGFYSVYFSTRFFSSN